MERHGPWMGAVYLDGVAPPPEVWMRQWQPRAVLVLGHGWSGRVGPLGFDEPDGVPKCNKLGRMHHRRYTIHFPAPSMAGWAGAAEGGGRARGWLLGEVVFGPCTLACSRLPVPTSRGIAASS